MKNLQTENNLKKEAIGSLGLVGVGAGLGLLAYGLEKSFNLLSGNRSVTEVMAGLNVDKKKVADFERDLQQVIEMSPKLKMISEAMSQAVDAYIKACQQALPQMKAQIHAAENKIETEKRKQNSSKNNSTSPSPSPSSSSSKAVSLPESPTKRGVI